MNFTLHGWDLCSSFLDEGETRTELASRVKSPPLCHVLVKTTPVSMWYMHVDVTIMWQSAVVECARDVQNVLGGGDGACRVGHGLDPVNCFFPQGFGGVVFEANRSLEQALTDNLAQFAPGVQIVLEAAAEETVSERLEEALSRRPFQVSKDEVDIIKVDVDGPDCHLVRGLSRAGWRPKIWHVEVNPLFPPGITVWPHGPSLGSQTTVNRQGDLSSAFSRRGAVHEKQALVGCSVQALLDSAGPEYVFLHMEFENAVLLREDISTALEPWLSSRDIARASGGLHARDDYIARPV